MCNWIFLGLDSKIATAKKKLYNMNTDFYLSLSIYYYTLTMLNQSIIHVLFEFFFYYFKVNSYLP